jgi:hypothetical protein
MILMRGGMLTEDRDNSVKVAAGGASKKQASKQRLVMRS